MKGISYYVLIGIVLTFSGVQSWAQPSILYYKGLGRVLIDQDNLDESSAALEGDTTSERRDLNGQFVFDLDVNVEPSDKLRVSSILRMTNEFGGFYSIGSLLQFRQIQIKGVLADKVNYQVGDIDVKLTPYTLQNNPASWYAYEASIFSDRRFIMHYENFNTEDFWRMQGFQANTQLQFTKGIETLDIYGLGTRVRRSDFEAATDRLFVGGQLMAGVTPDIKVGVTGVHMFDAIGTAPDTLSEFQNSVVTGTLNIGKMFGSMKLSLEAEAGMSDYQAANLEQDTAVDKMDNQVDVALKWELPAKLVSAKVGYRHVGEDFHSPGAQTRRTMDGNAPGLFATMSNGAFGRTQTLFDRFNDIDIYNQELNASLSSYAYRYNLALPFGVATPNRTGANVALQAGHKDSSFVVTAEAAFMDEVIGEGVEETRSFSLIQVGSAVNLSELIGWEKDLTVTAGVKLESASRSGSATVDATNTYLDAGITAETFKDLDIQVGLKSLNAVGEEFSNERNGFSEIVSFSAEEYEIQEMIFAFGLRYRFSNYNYLSLSHLRISFEDQLNETLNYQVGQWFVNYTLQF